MSCIKRIKRLFPKVSFKPKLVSNKQLNTFLAYYMENQHISRLPDCVSVKVMRSISSNVHG